VGEAPTQAGVVPFVGEGVAMNALHIICLNCHRSWRLDIGYSVYLRLALESQPCPSCECCTLSCQEASKATRRVPGAATSNGTPKRSPSPGY
jgi:hypothetical protein